MSGLLKVYKQVLKTRQELDAIYRRLYSLEIRADREENRMDLEVQRVNTFRDTVNAHNEADKKFQTDVLQALQDVKTAQKAMDDAKEEADMAAAKAQMDDALNTLDTAVQAMPVLSLPDGVLAPPVAGSGGGAVSSDPNVIPETGEPRPDSPDVTPPDSSGGTDSGTASGAGSTTGSETPSAEPVAAAPTTTGP